MAISRLKVLLLITFIFISVVTKGQLMKGLYYGEKRGLITIEAFLVVDSTHCIAEIFQPLKGQVVKVLTDTLISSLDAKTLYRGKKSEIIKEANLYIKQLTKEGSFDFDMVGIKYSPDHSRKHNEYENRAYLFEDRDACINILKEKVGPLPRIYSDFDRLSREYRTLELAMSLTHEDFVIRYGQIRKEILGKIME